MQRRHSPYEWKAWRDTIIAVVVVIAIGSLASASPSLRAPRGPHETVRIVPTGATEAGGPAGATSPTEAGGLAEPSGPSGTTTHDIESGENGERPSDGPDFTVCEGLTGLDNAICRLEALLVVHPDDWGLQNALTRLLENKAEHQANTHGHDGGHVPPGGGSSSSSNDHGQSGESHGNTGAKGNGNGKGNAGGNGKGH
jgi:hypothetical protein